ncbi:hypothetical protein ZOSMA_65G00050 [Zostera marina]|uniref:Uncharacterized protein n=1 Tax=Zostera marina TaxID=29655 RepID=A0A0K9NUQ7_ZOSMR|nr:hypothetical protein ZOSMA_65G00050 [Zostera marina]
MGILQIYPFIKEFQGFSLLSETIQMTHVSDNVGIARGNDLRRSLVMTQGRYI